MRPRDLETAGVAREYLLRLVRKGILERTGRGLYHLKTALLSEHHSLAEVAIRFPSATLCLLTALVFHEMTTQNPDEIWMALPRGSRTPQAGDQRIRTVRFSGPALTEGSVIHRIESVAVPIYSPAKTVADCFKFRNKVGLDVAIEALRNGVRQRKATVAEIRHYSAICRVGRVIQPYLDSLG